MCIRICIYIHIYIYRYIYTYKYIYVHIHIHLHTCSYIGTWSTSTFKHNWACCSCHSRQISKCLHEVCVPSPPTSVHTREHMYTHTHVYTHLHEVRGSPYYWKRLTRTHALSLCEWNLVARYAEVLNMGKYTCTGSILLCEVSAYSGLPPLLPPSSLLSSATSSESLSLSLSLPFPLSWSRSWTASIYLSNGFCSIKAPNHLIRLMLLFSLPNKMFSSFAGSSICSNLFYIWDLGKTHPFGAPASVSISVPISVAVSVTVFIFSSVCTSCRRKYSSILRSPSSPDWAS